MGKFCKQTQQTTILILHALLSDIGYWLKFDSNKIIRNISTTIITNVHVTMSTKPLFLSIWKTHI